MRQRVKREVIGKAAGSGKARGWMDAWKGTPLMRADKISHQCAGFRSHVGSCSGCEGLLLAALLLDASPASLFRPPS